MNAEFETRVREIAVALEGSVEQGAATPPETALFLLSLPKEDADAHLELGLIEQEGTKRVAIRGILPFRGGRNAWPMPYGEVGDVTGVREFVILVPALTVSAGDMVDQIRHLLLPLYLPALVMTRVALAQKADRSRSSMDQLVAACGVKPIARGAQRFATRIGPDGRVLAFCTLEQGGRVRVAMGGLTVKQAARVLRTVADDK